jgi:hypothetical protein
MWRIVNKVDVPSTPIYKEQDIIPRKIEPVQRIHNISVVSLVEMWNLDINWMRFIRLTFITTPADRRLS